MGGHESSDNSWSYVPLSAVFRFSSRPNRAHQISWRLWGVAAFQEAVQHHKPIFLLIASSWSHWSHLMDETTLSDPRIIAILNHDYVSIRVDGDLRPDVYQRYHQNGWPSVVLLSAEGEPLWGGVYVPPNQLLASLGHIQRYYSEHWQDIAEQAQRVRERRPVEEQAPLPAYGCRSLHQEERMALANLPAEAGVILRDLYDEEYGGFKIHPHLKFPHSDALELLLLLSRHNQPDALEMVCHSLQQMFEGGLWDEEEGGFFHYSSASDWSMPHTEKMLNENAALLRLLLLTAQYSQSEQWSEKARSLVRYIHTTLWQPKVGIFSGSQSADEEYYEPAPYSRALRLAPPIDMTVYTAWNARMISAYLLGAQVLHDPSLDTMALRALDCLCDHLMHRNGCMYHYALDGQAALRGHLVDQVWVTRALLDAYERHQRRAHLETAIALMHFVCEELLDGQSGLFYDYPKDAQAQGRLVQREQPLIENALAAECLLRMAALSKRQHLREIGLLVLSGCLEKYRRTGIQGTTYACVIERAIEQQWL